MSKAEALKAIEAWMNKQCYPATPDIWISNMNALQKILKNSYFKEKDEE